jgi:hypothetical protein
MTVRVAGRDVAAASRGNSGGLPVGAAGALPVEDVLLRLDSRLGGLSGAQAAARLAVVGPNAVRSHQVRAWAVLVRQLRSALLVVMATIAFFLGDRTDAVIIAVILAVSVGLGFVNEYRAERAAQALHSQIRYTAVVLRDGTLCEVDVVDLVPGDVVRLQLGAVVPADLRLLGTTGLECDEGVLTGESMPVDKDTAPVADGAVLAELRSRADGHHRAYRRWPGDGGGHRGAYRVRPHRPGSGPTTARDGLPGRAASLLGAAAGGRAGVDHRDLRDQPAVAPAAAGRVSPWRSRSGSPRSCCAWPPATRLRKPSFFRLSWLSANRLNLADRGGSSWW